MKRVIYKYKFLQGEGREIMLDAPVGKVLLIAAQLADDLLPTIWVEHSEHNLNSGWKERYQIVPTGHEFDREFWHQGSAICANGSLVWHVYRKALKENEQ